MFHTYMKCVYVFMLRQRLANNLTRDGKIFTYSQLLFSVNRLRIIAVLIRKVNTNSVFSVFGDFH